MLVLIGCSHWSQADLVRWKMREMFDGCGKDLMGFGEIEVGWTVEYGETRGSYDKRAKLGPIRH